MNLSHPAGTRPGGTASRRAVLLGTAGAAAALALPRASFAADAVPAPKASLWPEKAFSETRPDAALSALFGTSATTTSDQVKMEAPDIAENGAVVPVTLDANVGTVTRAALIAVNNPYSLACAYEIPEGTSASVASRLKLAKTTPVIGVVESGDKLYATSKQVKVTLGGCG